VKICGPCAKRMVEDPHYLALTVVCRAPKVILSLEGVKDVIRMPELFALEATRWLSTKDPSPNQSEIAEVHFKIQVPTISVNLSP
jgi:hypothetical protein